MGRAGAVDLSPRGFFDVSGPIAVVVAGLVLINASLGVERGAWRERLAGFWSLIHDTVNTLSVSPDGSGDPCPWSRRVRAAGRFGGGIPRHRVALRQHCPACLDLAVPRSDGADGVRAELDRVEGSGFHRPRADDSSRARAERRLCLELDY